VSGAQTIRLVREFADREAWNAFVRAHPSGHLFQTYEWGELQEGLESRPLRIAALSDRQIVGAVQILVFLTGRRTFAYVPRGPVCDPDERELAAALLDAALVASHEAGADFLRIEPQWTFTEGLAYGLAQRGWVQTSQSIMLPRTILVDLEPDLETIWARFRSNTRNRIRLAEKLGVDVRVAAAADDAASFIALAEETAARQQLHRDSRQYALAWRHFGGSDGMRLYLAAGDGVDLAGVIVFVCGTNATYLWGASSGSAEARRFNPNQLLHWTAMQWARERGCTTYDLHGIPDHEEAVLEAEYSRQTGGTWNLYRFKRGFGGRVHRHLGTYDWVFRS
jgi:lipid II:glycine glycyltransferase (peptidoglycan interpeptide bridge formation enzyme)